MKLRKLFAGVAAAATLLGGMAFGATTANAAEANISSTTITVNATDANQFYTKPVDTADLQANLRMFKYVELAKYVSDGNTGVEPERVGLAGQHYPDRRADHRFCERA